MPNERANRPIRPERALTRRRLLQSSAGAVAGPLLVKEGVIGRHGKPGANDTIRLAYIGTGGRGMDHVEPGAAAVCDVDDGHIADALKKTGGNPFVTKDFRRILDRSDVDAVMIATPDHWHAVMTVMACQAGKDVYCEKPTAKTIEEGQAMIAAARKYGRIVQIGAQGRSQRYSHAACEYVRNGQIGQVSRVEVWHPTNWTDGWGKEEPAPSSLDWEMWLGPARSLPYNAAYCFFNFRWMMEFGAGFIRDRGNHVLSIVSWLMNVDRTGPVSVEATGMPSPDGVWDVPVTMNVTWKFENPAWTLTWGQPGDPKSFPGSTDKIEWGARYYGDKGELTVSGGDSSGTTEQKAFDYAPPPDGIHIPESLDHRQNWLDSIKTRKLPIMDVAIGHRVVTMPIIANISYRLGRPLRWDPAHEHFIGDGEANRLLSMPYRAPWRI
ncbi:MAG: Gfo/Idh/MocA family oxidoreductase [Armatimonadetes bacterium]|nr:Gfo/Idh/MocA family oxidoreductase [Armatimonadota bacterium]MDE2206911.1 Gfo/Idh/MocA family oxidoreductase [Armatimonadota bacterium]